MPSLPAAMRERGAELRQRTVEGRRDRMAFAREAGLGRASLPSAVAGTMVAYGTFAVLVALVGGIAARVASSGHSDLSPNDWQNLGTGAGIAVAVLLALSYLFGGYVAGRMARRGGVVNGLLVFFLGVVVAAGVAAIVGTQTDSGTIVRNLRNVGVPTSGKEWSQIGTVAGVAALVAMLVGAATGGILGERWHNKLAARAADPGIGPAAEERRREAQARVDREAQARVDREARGSFPAAGESTEGVPASQQSPGDGPQGARSARTVKSDEGGDMATEAPDERHTEVNDTHSHTDRRKDER